MAETEELKNANPFYHVPIEILVSVGKARPLVKDLLKLKNDSVLTLDQKIDDPVELYVGDRLIAKGELQEGEGEHAGQLVVRLTEVADLKDGL
ncbi:FliM/FliN family flagellar motor switch protein [Celeribacter arenosi]|uniref:Flagellar motor switch protein FliN n=1 Tax=Celeribacter arenosi TaxID=792649 RepID=A0ABP7K084_9RHOB